MGVNYKDACGVGALRVRFCRPFDCRERITFVGNIPDYTFDIIP
jgi:hypothetical protein